MSAMRCPRQAWLQEQLAGDTGDKAVQGQLLHEVVQYCMSQALEGGLSEQVLLAEVRRRLNPKSRFFWKRPGLHRNQGLVGNAWVHNLRPRKLR